MPAIVRHMGFVSVVIAWERNLSDCKMGSGKSPRSQRPHGLRLLPMPNGIATVFEGSVP